MLRADTAQMYFTPLDFGKGSQMLWKLLTVGNPSCPLACIRSLETTVPAVGSRVCGLVI